MTNAEINELMAAELKALLIKYDIYNGTKIYFNDKCYTSQPSKIEVFEDIKAEAYLEWCNPEMISIAYEVDDSLYMAVNWYVDGKEAEEKANRVITELTEIGDRYNRYYDVGDDFSLFFKSKDDKREFGAFHHINSKIEK